MDFRHVTTWIFDLDNTLYAPEVRLFAQIERRMTAFVMRELRVTEAEANRLRNHYWPKSDLKRKLKSTALFAFLCVCR